MKKILMSAALLLLMTGAHGQTTGIPLTIDEALAKTLTDNPEIAAIKYEERAAEMERRAAFGLRLPQLGVTGVYAHLSDDIGIDLNGLKGGVRGILGVAGDLGIQLPPDVTQGINTSLSRNWEYVLQEKDFGFVTGTITLPIFTGGKINAANRAARINEQSVYQQGEQTRNGLISQLVERYYGLSLAADVVKVREQVVEAMRKHLDDAVALEQNGIISRADRLYVEVKLAEAERELLTAKSNYSSVTSSLKNTLNDTITYEPSSRMFIVNDIRPLFYFQGMALEMSPLLKEVSLKKDLAKEGVNVQKADFFPQIAALGGYQLYQYQTTKAAPDWAVGAGVKFKIFDGLQREYKFSAAKQTVRQVESLEIKAQNDITILIESLYNEMTSIRDRVPSLDKSLEFSEEYLRMKNAGFREGVATSVDVVDAELNLAAVRIERVQTAYLYDVMLARLLEASGLSDTFVNYANNPYAIYVDFDSTNRLLK